MELLLAMAIIAVLASLALVVVGDAQDDSRRSDTQSRISLLNSIIETRLENYETLRLPINLKNAITPSEEDLLNRRETRRRVIMDIVSSEMPRSYDDVADSPGQIDASDTESIFPSQRFIDWMNTEDFFDSPSLFVEDVAAQVRTSTADRFVARGNPGGEDDGLAGEIRTSSEYLYWILQDTHTAGTTGLEVLGDRFIGDTDNDGFLEIVDSWGNPIGFQFVMFDEEGNRVNNGTGNPMDLDPGFVDPDNDHPTIENGVPTSNIRMFMFSTAGARPEDVSAAVNNNGLELITN